MTGSGAHDREGRDDRDSRDDIQQMLEARYGTGAQVRSEDRRILGSVVVLSTALIAFLIWATLIGATPAASGTLLRYSLLSDEQVRVTFQVRTRSGLEGPFTCVLRAQDAERIDVGYALVRIPPTDGSTQVVDYDLTTRSRGRVIEVLGCGEGLQAPRDVPDPQFPPGVRPPDQQPPGRAP
jgi:hypothetical protein